MRWGRGGDWERQRGDTRTARGTNTPIHTHPHPATPRERLCPQQELHPRKSREQLGDAASFGKAGRCFGSGMAARIGNLDWELVGFSHQILQFWHGVLCPNPFLQHYPMGWIWFSSCLGFLVLPKPGFVGHFLNVKSHISCGYSYFLKNTRFLGFFSTPATRPAKKSK